ncbi:MAG: MBL fold metallo-hydrolase [Ignavibacteriae bacterium]|nr:MBL fold metallo-hydrolase [Ignavibacteria bacterium]MBI3365261.1 MBL fold metallo-hydrolase [Ignavibacteriota bacterium]
MTSLKWTIGDVDIFQMVELEAGKLIQSIIKNATPERIQDINWLSPHFADDQGNLKALVQGFLIKSDGKNILIDTCNGNDKRRIDIPEWANLQTGFLQKLGEFRLTEKDINVVACTHLHMDHVGWNTRLEHGVWLPTFPNAKYLFAQEEYEYWVKKPEKEIADDKAAFDDSVNPIIEAGLAQLVSADFRIDRHVSFMPTAGHTPAHVSVVVESKNQRAIISGDVLHHPCQIANPTWSTDADTLPEKALATRRRVLNAIAGTETLLIGSHFANPVAGRVVRTNNGYVFKI